MWISSLVSQSSSRPVIRALLITSTQLHPLISSSFEDFSLGVPILVSLQQVQLPPAILWIRYPHQASFPKKPQPQDQGSPEHHRDRGRGTLLSHKEEQPPSHRVWFCECVHNYSTAALVFRGALERSTAQALLFTWWNSQNIFWIKQAPRLCGLLHVRG